jgi:alpha-D-ribose 1-methylphosphonate 5-triphosphate synthase subunit PhnG
MVPPVTDECKRARSGWLRILSLSDGSDLAAVASPLINVPFEYLRTPETGLVMLRGRMGSTGAPFNFGEATVTRCAVHALGHEGHAYVLGRNIDHARMAALCDALLQSAEHSRKLHEHVLSPLAARLRDRHLKAAGKAAATKVDFFTLVRGDD